MPLYDFRCSEGHVFERMVPLAEFDVLQNCSCNAPAKRLISLPMISVENVGYNCPVTGDWIGSKREHSNNLAKHGCRVLETGEKEAAATYRQTQDANLDKRIEETVEKSIETLDSGKKEQLYNELIRQGLDAVVTRETA